MQIEAIKSKLITPGDNLSEVLLDTLQGYKIREKTIIVIASKVVAITQGRQIEIHAGEDFNKLVNREADVNYGGKEVTLTKKNQIFIPWAGVDRSNIPKNTAVMWPENPYKEAKKILEVLKREFGINDLGIIITDSYCTPLRKGVTAVALGYAGFKGVNDLRGHKDLHGNKLHVSRQGIADMLASAAHLVMGESNEQTPFAIIIDAPANFTLEEVDPEEATIPEDECLFNPLYRF